jgi:hypothetical protein
VTHHLEPLGSRRVVRVQGVHAWPERHPEPAKVRTEVSRGWISSIELPVRGEHGLHDRKQRRIQSTKKVVNGLGVEVTTEQLKVR